MKKIIPFLFLAFFLSNFANAQRAVNKTSADGVIVRFAEGVDVQEFITLKKLDSGFGVTIRKALAPRFGLYLLDIEKAEKKPVLYTELNMASEVIATHENRAVDFRNTEPNDPFWPQQWGVERIGAPKVWDVTTGGLTENGDEIVIAVIDRGFDVEHPDWQGNLWENPGEVGGSPGVDDDMDGYVDNIYGYNFYNDSQFLWGEDHGTWVAGIAGAKGDNGIGVTGVNWDVKMMLLRIETVADVIEAMNFVLEEREKYNATNGEEGSFIVATNGSFGIDRVFCENQADWGILYDPLGEAGILSVAATANQDWDVEIEGDMPTTCTSEYIIAVTAVDNDDEKVSNAAYGSASIDLGAPTYVPSTTPGNGFRESITGTSAACPHVTGAVALLYSVPCSELADMALSGPAAAARLVRDAILKNTEQLSDLQGTTTTGGLIDVYEAMKYLHAYCISRPSDREAETFKEDYIEEKSFVYLSPNPTSDILNITYGNEGFGEIQVRIFNVLGQEVDFQGPLTNMPFENQTIMVDVHDWNPGTYVVSIKGAEKSSSIKFIKI